MGNYTMFGKFENPRRGMQARNLTTNVPKILDLKSSSEQIFSKNCRWVPLNSVTTVTGAGKTKLSNRLFRERFFCCCFFSQSAADNLKENNSELNNWR